MSAARGFPPAAVLMTPVALLLIFIVLTPADNKVKARELGAMELLLASAKRHESSPEVLVPAFAALQSICVNGSLRLLEAECWGGSERLYASAGAAQ